jgi:hypothetical protein
MHKDTKSLREAIQHCKEKAQGDSACAKEHAQLAEWLSELLHYRGGPWCPGCGSPVVNEGDECHSCRDDTHEERDRKWLSRYKPGYKRL